MVFNNGPQVKDLFFLVPISLFGGFLFNTINDYLYDKDTIIEIDANGNITYINITQRHFHLEDIDVCTKALPNRFCIGFTEITLKDRSRIDVSNFIDLEPIYKMNSNIRREKMVFFWPINLKQKNNN